MAELKICHINPKPHRNVFLQTHNDNTEPTNFDDFAGLPLCGFDKAFSAVGSAGLQGLLKDTPHHLSTD